MIHTILRERFWINEFGDGTLHSKHLTKAQAITAGRDLAEVRHSEHVIHNEDGTVAGRSDYGVQQTSGRT